MKKENRIEQDGEWVLDRDQQPKLVRRDEMDDKIDPTEFWKDPNAFRGRGLDPYIDTCVPEFFFGFRHFSRRLVEAIAGHVGYGESILELGCSVGRNLFHLHDEGYEHLTGVEINPESCRLARKWFLGVGGEDWIQIINSSIEFYFGQSGVPDFDLIFTQSVLMHIPLESNWIFRAMAERAKTIVTHEIEGARDRGEGLEWPRNYQEIFEPYGFKQIEMTEYNPQTLRVMRKE